MTSPETPQSPSAMAVSGRGVTAVLGPTNTGKTHLAIERMLGYESGLIGLPLRLLAREVYDRVAARAGEANVALITGEEKIKPPSPRYWVCTVEAMPRDLEVDFVAIDEVQLAADPERGHVFTNRLLNARGTHETLLLGASTMRGVIERLLPGANFVGRPRLSKLSYAGQKKISRLPRRTAVVAFSAADVYTIAELIRRQRGGAAVVLGALSPRTRNAQVALYQSEDVDFLVATDAIGMGLNLDVGHVAFAGARKFDGQQNRDLTASEMAQIAGRAGRHLNDGTFGVTGDVEPFEADLVEKLENHEFEPVRMLQWRSNQLDFKSVASLKASLEAPSQHASLARARAADDIVTLESALKDDEVRRLAASPAAIKRLWEVCQVPDYRKISAASHTELVVAVYKHLLGDRERIPEDWFAEQVAVADRTDGDIDTLATRIAHIRTWTFMANRSDWLDNHEHWQGQTREVEDRLSDALHEQLTSRFVDRKTSTLMRSMRDQDELFAEIAEDGAIHVEKHFVGRIRGFRYVPDTNAEDVQGKASRHAAARVLSKELAMRARRIAAAKLDAITLGDAGSILWRGEEIGRLEAGEMALAPRAVLLSDEHLSGPDLERVQARLTAWVGEILEERLQPLMALSRAEDFSGLARGIAFQLTERLGTLKRADVASDIKSLDQDARSQLRKYGVRFGAFNIYFPALLKPGPSELLAQLWRLQHPQENEPVPPRAGLTSVVTEEGTPEGFYRAAGYHRCGPRAVRVDMLERLADMIRPLVSWRNKSAANGAAANGAAANATAPAPEGATGDGGFTPRPGMMSILGCSGDELGEVLKVLGFRMERKRVAPASAAILEPMPCPVPEMDTAAAAESVAEGAGEAGAPDDAQYIEIWRPRRMGGRGGPPRRANARGNRERGAQAGETTKNGDAKPAPDQKQRQAAGGKAQDGRAQDDRAKGHKGPKGPKGQRHDRGQAGAKRRPEQNRAAAVTSAAPPQRKGKADPDSPFAALGQLKKELEKNASDPKN